MKQEVDSTDKVMHRKSTVDVLARGGEVRGHKRGVESLGRKFLNFKSKMAYFCALLIINFKVCRLIGETVSDHIRKTVTNRLSFLPLFQSLRGKNQ